MCKYIIVFDIFEASLRINLGTNCLNDGFDALFLKINSDNFSLYFVIEGEFKHEVRQFEKSYDNQQAEQISLMV